MEIVVPSKQRANRITSHTLQWFPEAIVCIEETEVRDYSGLRCRLLAHPPLPGLSAIINWILDCQEIMGESIAIVDDDLMNISSIVDNNARRITDPRAIATIVENCRAMAEGFGARLWGFSVNRRSDSNYAFRPFSLSARIGSFRGFSDRSIRLDESFRRHDDADLTLSELLTRRIVFRDDRFNFVFRPIYNTPGGQTDALKQESQSSEEKRLVSKWGRYIALVKSPYHEHETRICVER